MEIRFDLGRSYQLPYSDQSFDLIFSSLFFHHLTREDKRRTLLEVRRVLRPAGTFHLVDWGSPANQFMKIGSFFVRVLDGFETTGDNFMGNLPGLMEESGFENTEETASFNTLFGTVRLYESRIEKQELL